MFRPDLIVGKVTDISPLWLANEGVKAIILDIDDTLVPHGMTSLPEDILKWLRDIHSHDIKIAFLSNNKMDRQSGLVPGIDTLHVSHAAKPGRRGYRKIFSEFNIQPKDAFMIGDQLFTDIWGANRSGCRSAFVTPLTENGGLLFRIKRSLEKPLIKKYRKTGKSDDKIRAGRT